MVYFRIIVNIFSVLIFNMQSLLSLLVHLKMQAVWKGIITDENIEIYCSIS